MPRAGCVTGQPPGSDAVSSASYVCQVATGSSAAHIACGLVGEELCYHPAPHTCGPDRPTAVLKRTKANRREGQGFFLHFPAQRNKTAQADCPNTFDAQVKHKTQLTDPSEDRPAASGKSFCYLPAFFPAQHDAGKVDLQAGFCSRSAANK